jgi:hypothetical protein
MAGIDGVLVVSLRLRVERVVPLRAQFVPCFDLHVCQPYPHGVVGVLHNFSAGLTLMMSFGRGVLSGLSLIASQYGSAGHSGGTCPPLQMISLDVTSVIGLLRVNLCWYVEVRRECGVHTHRMSTMMLVMYDKTRNLHVELREYGVR